MIKKITFFTFLLSCQFLIGQQAIDTVDTEKGKIVFFTNRTWQFLKDKSFDGILNRRIHELVKRDSLNFKQPWENDVCYSSLRHNDMSRLKDTIWLCVLEEEHSKFHFPVDGIVTSRYGFRHGRHHSGIDIDLDVGDTVRSLWSGKVRYS